MIEALDDWVRRAVRRRRSGRSLVVERRVVNEVAVGAALTGRVATADLSVRRRHGDGVNALDCTLDPGRLVRCPMCGVESGVPCRAARHPARDAVAALRRCDIYGIEVTPSDIRGRRGRRLYVCEIVSSEEWHVTVWALDDAGERSCIVGTDLSADLLASLRAFRGVAA